MKQIKNTRFKGLCASLLGLFVLSGCAKQPLTHSLFQQTGRAQILLPTQEEEETGLLIERSDFQTVRDTIRPESSALPADSGSVTLQTFTIVADRPLVRISTVRNGYVNLKFLVTLPKEFMQDRWQVELTPTLINGEEETEMPPIVLQGKEFKAKQDEQYSRFEAFSQGLITPAGYDSLFFDKRKHKKYMDQLKREYFDLYEAEFSLMQRYLGWKRLTENRRIQFDIWNSARYDRSVSNKSLRTLANAYDANLYGEDSTALMRKLERYTPERRSSKLAAMRRTIALEDVPRAYREFHRKGWTLDSIKNKSLTQVDSLRVAQHTYNYNKIAENEGRIENLDTYREHYITLPRIDSTHLTQEIETDTDYAHLYSRDVEVKEGLARRLKVILATRVTAIDNSMWHQEGLDTLNFIVSGINDLVDRTLIERLSGEDHTQYQEGLNRLAAYDYKGALDILNQYPDFNSAICLSALGHNDNAILLLDKLNPATPRMDYLRAIIYARQGHHEHARDFLLHSARRENSLAFKADIEPEFASLFDKYPDLKDELTLIGEGE